MSARVVQCADRVEGAQQLPRLTMQKKHMTVNTMFQIEHTTRPYVNRTRIMCTRSCRVRQLRLDRTR